MAEAIGATTLQAAEPDITPNDGDRGAMLWGLVGKLQAAREAVREGATTEEAATDELRAWSALYDEIYPDVFKFIWRRIQPRELAEDLTQEVMLRSIRGIGGLTEVRRSSPTAWFLQTARNITVDYYKSAHNRLSTPIADLFDTDGPRIHLMTPAPHPEAETERLALRALLRPAIATLSPGQQLCIKLRFFEELTVEETAVAMGVDASAAKASQYRALQALRKLLEGTGAKEFLLS
jgi:RNA polymerase sigma-70 factor (ECF subfamily)